MNNGWAGITNSHWVHPSIGYVKCISSNVWEIVPKKFLGEPKIFKTFEECIKHGNTLYEKYQQKF